MGGYGPVTGGWLGIQGWLTGALREPTGMLVIGTLGVALWCRGLWLGTIPVATDTLARRFILGASALVGLCGLLALGKGMGVERYTDRIELLALAYFVVSPSVIALVNAQTVGDQETRAGSLSMVWIVALILPMLIVACVGLVLSNKVAFALTYGLHAFGKAVLLVWDLLAWIWFWLIFVVQWVIGAWWPSADKRGAADSLSVVQPPWHRQDAAGTATELPLYVPATAVLALVAILFVYLAVQRTRLHRRENTDDERSWLFSWALLRQQVRSILLDLFDRYLRRGDATIAEMIEPHLAPTSEWVSRDIRHLYRGLLRWAAAKGHRRQPAMTPRELEDELLTSVPEAAESVGLITGAYEDARYGDAEIDDRTLAAAGEAVNSLNHNQHPASTTRPKGRTRT